MMSKASRSSKSERNFPSAASWGRSSLVAQIKPDIGLASLAAANTLVLAIFDDPEEFFLHPHWCGGQLIEK